MYAFILKVIRVGRRKEKVSPEKCVYPSHKINEILVKHGRSKIKAYDNDTVGALILDNILDFRNPNNSNSNNSTNPTKEQSLIIKYNLVNDLLVNNLIDVNIIKNFLNQTILHFSCENNDLILCKLLLDYGADCLIEDNYRLSPFVLSAKRNYFDLLKLFCESVKKTLSNELSNTQNESKCWEQIRRASYYACCSGHIDVARFLFKTFNLYSEQISDDASWSTGSKSKFTELNLLHVACYKANFEIVEFLLSNTQEKHNEAFMNKPINEFRDCTPLEEAFKGFLMLDFNSNLENKRKNGKFFAERKLKIDNHFNIINLLIENGCKFSSNFILNNGLNKLLAQIFSGPQKDVDFVHFLYCCNFLFKYKLEEVFDHQQFRANRANYLDINGEQKAMHKKDSLENKSSTLKLNSIESLKEEFDLSKMIEDFLYRVYYICLKVLKDYKGKCLSYYVEILFNLHYSGQMYLNMNKLSYLKERNSEIFNILESVSRKPLTLKSFCSISIRKSIKNYGINKIEAFQIPNELKSEIFYNSLSKTGLVNSEKSDFNPIFM